MKRVFSIFFLVLIAGRAYAQDSLTPEKKVRFRINQIQSKRALNTSQGDLTDALTELANMTATRTPYVTIKQLRAGAADSARVVYVNDAQRSGIFAYNPGNTTAADDSAMTIVFPGL